MSDLLKNVIKEYDIYKEYDYIFFISKSKKKKVTTDSLVVKFSPESFKHLIGCQKLVDKVLNKHSAVLFNTLCRDLKNDKLSTNNDFSNIQNSENFNEIENRLELLSTLSKLIVNYKVQLYQHNPKSTQSIDTKIKYDYLIKFSDENCSKNCYLFCKRDKFSFALEPVSVFKTEKNYHKGHLLWNVEGFYTSKKTYEKKREHLYSGYPSDYQIL